jgi:hypothetical protein
MKTTTIVAIVLLAVVAILGLSFIGVYNSCNSQEKGILAVHNDMQNVHASMFNQMKSQGLAVEKYGDMVIQAINEAMSGRYGEGGSRAAFQWIQENNPTIDAAVMEKLQVAIEAGYNRFEATQRTKIDRLRIYKRDLDSFPKGFIAKIFGYPKINLAEMEQVISTKETKKTFETKEMETIDPFAK